jgi:putative addiction module killer protein
MRNGSRASGIGKRVRASMYADCRFGNPGDVRPGGQGVSELRIDYGPGYRIYFKRSGDQLVILLAGGDKRTQARDIEIALDLARHL